MGQILLQITNYTSDSILWDELLSQDKIQHPFGFPLDQKYMKAYASGNYVDHSVLALTEGVPVAGLQVTLRVTQDGALLDFYGRPAMLRVSSKYNHATLLEAEDKLAEYLHKLIGELNQPKLTLMEIPEGNHISEFATRLIGEGFTSTPLYKQVIDLSLHETDLRSHVRRRYKTHINYGEKTMEITTHDRSNISSGIMEKFRNLHVCVAGRETRTIETWITQEEMIKNGEAFLVTGTINRELVTGAFFINTPKYCYYGVGASIREMFDKPLSHAIIWRGIMEAKKCGCQVFDLGDRVDLYSSGYSEKEQNIADFKAGFGGVTKVDLMLNSPPI